MARNRTAVVTMMTALAAFLATPGVAAATSGAMPRVPSAAALTALQHKIDADTPQLRTEGIAIVATRVAADAHTVDVLVAQLNQPVWQALMARYGPALTLEQHDYLHTMDRSNVGPPWPGGMELLGSCVGSTDCIVAGCSAGYTAWQYIQNVRFYYKLTAGHCFTPNTAVTSGSGVPVGHVIQSWFSSGSNADAEDILISPGTQTPKIITSDPTQAMLQTAAPTPSTSGICKSGITTGETCGWGGASGGWTIHLCEDPDCTVFVTLVDQVLATRSSYGIGPGDSGGPVYTYVSGGVRAEGLVSGGSDDGMTITYSFIQDILGTSNLFLCFDLGNGTC